MIWPAGPASHSATSQLLSNPLPVWGHKQGPQSPLETWSKRNWNNGFAERKKWTAGVSKYFQTNTTSWNTRSFRTNECSGQVFGPLRTHQTNPEYRAPTLWTYHDTDPISGTRATMLIFWGGYTPMAKCRVLRCFDMPCTKNDTMTCLAVFEWSN